MNQYSYSSLDTGKESIRLLRLHPSEDEEADIQCEIFHYTLESSKGAHLYEALSYVWGDQRYTKPVFIGENQQIEVTLNLHAALKCLRNHALPRVLWVDAVCINQADEKEKQQQIQHMAKIYNEATRVIVWLGEMANGSNEAIQYINLAAQNGRAGWQGMQKHQSAVLSLLQRPWFKRVWVRI